MAFCDQQTFSLSAKLCTSGELRLGRNLPACCGRPRAWHFAEKILKHNISVDVEVPAASSLPIKQSYGTSWQFAPPKQGAPTSPDDCCRSTASRPRSKRAQCLRWCLGDVKSVVFKSPSALKVYLKGCVGGSSCDEAQCECTSRDSFQRSKSGHRSHEDVGGLTPGARTSLGT